MSLQFSNHRRYLVFATRTLCLNQTASMNASKKRIAYYWYWSTKLLLAIGTIALVIYFSSDILRSLRIPPFGYDDAEEEENVALISTSKYHGNYCVAYNFWIAQAPDSDDNFDNATISLVLHTTPGYLRYLPEQAESWQGLISLAIFLPTPTVKPMRKGKTLIVEPTLYMESAIALLNSMRRFGFDRRTSVHLFFERGTLPSCPAIVDRRGDTWEPKTENPEDDKVDRILERFDDFKEFRPINDLYPINVARNIARRGRATQLFLSGDIENVFVPNYELRMRGLAKKLIINGQKKTVLVHRRFEIGAHETMPTNKAELQAMFMAKTALQFHGRIYPVGHSIPKLKEWFAEPGTNLTATVFHEFEYFHGEWEPQFVADDKIPFHDENFPFRLRSHTHLAAELCRAGYTFTVVNDLFSVHRGIKRKETDDDKAFKQLSKAHNKYKAIVAQFKQRLNRLYPTTEKKCPRFVP